MFIIILSGLVASCWLHIDVFSEICKLLKLGVSNYFLLRNLFWRFSGHHDSRAATHYFESRRSEVSMTVVGYFFFISVSTLQNISRLIWNRDLIIMFTSTRH